MVMMEIGGEEGEPGFSGALLPRPCRTTLALPEAAQASSRTKQLTFKLDSQNSRRNSVTS